MPSDYGQGHALLSEKNALWHSSRAPCEQRDSGMKASTCQFSQCAPLCAGLPKRPTLQFNFRKGSYDCCWKYCCNILPWGSGFFFLPSLEERYFWCTSGMVDKLISCLRLLLSLGAVNGFYNSINSTLSALWVNSLLSTDYVRTVAPHHILMLHKDRSSTVTSIRWYFYAVHQQNRDNYVGLTQNPQ